MQRHACVNECGSSGNASVEGSCDALFFGHDESCSWDQPVMVAYNVCVACTHNHESWKHNIHINPCTVHVAWRCTRARLEVSSVYPASDITTLKVRRWVSLQVSQWGAQCFRKHEVAKTEPPKGACQAGSDNRSVNSCLARPEPGGPRRVLGTWIFEVPT